MDPDIRIVEGVPEDQRVISPVGVKLVQPFIYRRHARALSLMNKKTSLYFSTYRRHARALRI